MKTSLHLIGVVLSIFIGGQMLARPLEEEQKKSVEADAEVQSNLARMRGNGGGVPKDSADGVKRYLKAAEDGHAPFRSFLGSLYGSGDRYSAADLKWYQEAARQGNVVAQFGLGVMYAKGEGVSKDSVEAVNWLRKAADQEDRSAQLLLGLMYAEGNGVPKDSAEAVKWYRKAGGARVSHCAVLTRTDVRQRRRSAQGCNGSGPLVSQIGRPGRCHCSAHPWLDLRNRRGRAQGFSRGSEVVSQGGWGSRRKRMGSGHASGAYRLGDGGGFFPGQPATRASVSPHY